MKVAIYTRVSTRKRKPSDPDDPSASRDYKQNPALQLEACQRFALARGWKVVKHYTDRMTGAKASRPALEEMTAAAHRREFDALVVWKLDRFARSAAHAIGALHELDAKGVQFVSATEPQIDTTTPMGKAMLGVVAVFAELEHDLIAERVKAGMASAKARGVKLGRRRVAVPVLLAQQDIERGGSVREVAKKYRVSRSVLQRALKASQNAPSLPTLKGGGNQGGEGRKIKGR